MSVLFNKFEVEFNVQRDAVIINSPERAERRWSLIEIRRETLEKMSLKEAATFIGETFILLNPHLREMFKDYLWSEDGTVPPIKG